MMKVYDRIRDMAEDELSKITEHGELSPNMLPDVHLLTDIIKNVDKICVLNEDMGHSRDGGESHRGYSRDGGSSNRGYSREGGGSSRGSYGGGSGYGDGYSEEASYARRRRDRMGRYSRDDGKDYMMHRLGEMMHDANEHEREALERCMSELRRGD